MDGIIVVNKPSGCTSRDVANRIGKELNTKKVGHAGTLDPMATGVLVVGVNRGTKVLKMLDQDIKEYEAEVLIGVNTDTLDTDGNILNTSSKKISLKELREILDSFKGTYNQEVPKYSAVKVNGKRLYEYARSGIDIELPSRSVNIYEIELTSDIYERGNNYYFKFRSVVSKGTYIRSLIRDIADKLGTYMCMSNLCRLRQGNFYLKDASSLDDLKIISIDEVFKDFKSIDMDMDLYKKVIHGNKIELNMEDSYVLLKYNKKLIAIYKKDHDIYRCYVMIDVDGLK